MGGHQAILQFFPTTSVESSSLRLSSWPVAIGHQPTPSSFPSAFANHLPLSLSLWPVHGAESDVEVTKSLRVLFGAGSAMALAFHRKQQLELQQSPDDSSNESKVAYLLCSMLCSLLLGVIVFLRLCAIMTLLFVVEVIADMVDQALTPFEEAAVGLAREAVDLTPDPFRIVVSFFLGLLVEVPIRIFFCVLKELITGILQAPFLFCYRF